MSNLPSYAGQNGSETYVQRIREFAATAQEYLALIDRRNDLAFDDFLMQLDAILPMVYFRCNQMTAVAPDDLFNLPSDQSRTEVDFDEFIQGEIPEPEDELASALVELFGEEDAHFVASGVVVEVGQEPAIDAFTHSTGFELSELYHAFESEFEFFNRGSNSDIKDAAFDWLQGFYAEWGEYLTHLISKTFLMVHGTISENEEDVEV